MSDLQTLRARVADKINRTDLNTQIDLEINRAIEYYAKKYRFWFNETTGTFNTVANQLIYTSSDSIPTLIREIDFVKIALSASDNVELEEKLYQEIQRWVISSSSTGSPDCYAYYKQNFYIYPIPTAVYTITVSYVKGYATLTAADSNDFTTNAEDLIEARAAFNIYDGFLHNYKSADREKAKELEALEALITETERLTATGKIRPTNF